MCIIFWIIFYIFGFIIIHIFEVVDTILETLFLIPENLTLSDRVDSDMSNRAQIDVVCVIDVGHTIDLCHRKTVLEEEVKQASKLANANLIIISVKLLFKTT